MTPGTGRAADRAALTADAMDPASLAAFLTFAALTPTRLLMFPGSAGQTMAVVSALLSLAFGALYLARRTGARAWLEAHAPEVGVAMALVASADSLTVLLVSGEAWVTAGVCLMVIVSGALLHAPVYTAAVVTVLGGAWTCAAWQHGFGSEWLGAAPVLGVAALTAVVVNTMRAAMADSLVRAQQELRRLATTDPLTGLHNRRGLVAAAAAPLDLALDGGRPLSLVFLDVDGLKRLNDTAGHAAGDDLLVATATALRGAVRRSDVVARVGGDEFVVLLMDTDARRAGEVMSVLRATLAAHGISASAGTATCPPEDPTGRTARWDLDGLLGAADAAMYADKQARRDEPPAPRAAAGGPPPPSAGPQEEGDDDAVGTVRTLYGVAALMFAGLALVQPLVHDAARNGPTVALFIATALACAGPWVLLADRGRRQRLSARHDRLLAALLAGVSATAVTAVALLADPETSTAVMLAVIATGAMLRSTRAVVGIVTVVLAAWLAVASAHGFSGLWGGFVPQLGAGAVVAAVLHVTLVRSTRRLSAAQAAVRAAALTDELTGLSNRHGLLLAAVPMAAACQRRATTVGVVSLDLDGLKRVNDEQGHAAGDALLRTAGRALADAVPAGAVAARLGGDEFAVLVPDTGPEDLEALREALVHALHHVGAAASSGTAASAGDLSRPEALEDLLHRADTAMYADKGRRRRGPTGSPEVVSSAR